MLIGVGLLAIGGGLLCYAIASARGGCSRTLASHDSLDLCLSVEPPCLAKSLDPSERVSPSSKHPYSPSNEAVLGVEPALAFLAEETAEPDGPPLDPSVRISYEEEAEEEETTSPHARILVSASGETDCGRKRCANDDSLLVLPEHSLFAVADGMGGYAGGSVASRLAVEVMQRAFEQGIFSAELRSERAMPRRGRELACAMVQAHEAVYTAARASSEHVQMGTTLVAARFSPNKQRLYIGHVGDSRCYRWRGGRLRQLTTDQTMGTIGLVGPRAGDLLQAIGVTSGLAVDLIVDKPKGSDVYLLCSDGLNKMVSDAQIERVLASQRQLKAAVFELIELANAAGGRDNVTVVLIKVLDRPLVGIATMPSLRNKNGWSQLPNAGFPDPCGADDETVIGGLPLEELTALIPTTQSR